ncbi:MULTISPECIES: hypothetical protein [Marivita]|uniref:Uncharacterized protein n=1 Tax=Marivita cryptomonadis TaxID=505252 RepID=A0A9Q2PAK2_9RHOB|nr:MULTISPECIES: hypothetical protein [Marivita]MCR9170560.1 hypothetical protein [Paracoccaceae bacterium]MBM2322031.1 hypothetical protein [Marivita cryptomonadis]MBM2331612.1 hypothetical protein [Marivita cryptomonadis]MBM2341197.1 hypothetical protein [Marivita cryptomonadis]MBM2345860.1 hypothetical protein [Marivita cryptomonadis]
MRHYPDLQNAGHTDQRRAKLFELHRQEQLQTGSGRAYPAPEMQRPDIALALRERAIRTLRPRDPYNSSVR